MSQGYEELKRGTFDRDVKVKYFELDGCQILKTIKFGYAKLVKLSIRDCSEFDKLPVFSGLSCLERIIVHGCGKFKYLQLARLQNLKSVRVLQTVEGTGDLTKLTNLWINGCQNLKSVSGNFELRQLHISDCPELEELPTLSRQSFLEQIVINSCEKVENIAGIEELHVLEHMQLSLLSNAAIRNCIAKLKSVPSQLTCVIGGAVDGMEATLNQYLFSHASIALQKIDVEWLSCIAVISFFVVVDDSSTSVDKVNNALLHYLLLDFDLGQGEGIITMVERDDRSKEIADVLLRNGILKKWFTVSGKEGEEWKVGLCGTYNS